MKKVCRSLAATLLLLAISTSAFADGQMDTGKTPPPSSVTGQIDTPPVVTNAEEVVSIDMLAEIALDISNFMPSLY